MLKEHTYDENGQKFVIELNEQDVKVLVTRLNLFQDKLFSLGLVETEHYQQLREFFCDLQKRVDEVNDSDWCPHCLRLKDQKIEVMYDWVGPNNVKCPLCDKEWIDETRRLLTEAKGENCMGCEGPDVYKITQPVDSLDNNNRFCGTCKMEYVEP